ILCMLQRDALSLSRIFWSIDVEERIDWLIGPFGDRDLMPRSPNVDLAQVLLDQRIAQVFAQCDPPYAPYRTTPLSGTSTGERHTSAHFRTGLVQTFDEIVRQKRAIAGHAEDPFNYTVLIQQPVEAGKNAG